MKKQWDSAEIHLLRSMYSEVHTHDVAAWLDRSISSVRNAAFGMGLHKSADYLESEAAGRIRRGEPRQAMTGRRFQPGHATWNKGVPGSTGVQEACRATQFAAGNKPQTTLPIGTLRVFDGVLQQKVSDCTNRRQRWQPVHRLVWERENGPVPPNHVVVFKPGRHTTDAAAITLDGLELVTRVELMRRNSYQNKYPPEVGKLIQLRGALNRQINKRAKEAA